MDNRKENMEIIDEGIELMEQESRHGIHALDRAIEATKKFANIFGKDNDGCWGGCTPEAQGISMSEYAQAQIDRLEAGIPLHEPCKPESSADKISALCDELRDYVLSKHNFTTLKEIDEVCDMCHELKRFLLVKNERYGDSALKPVKIFSKGDASDKIDIRMDDKMSRIIESDEQRMNDFVDLTGYLVLKCIDKGWTDFSELLD